MKDFAQKILDLAISEAPMGFSISIKIESKINADPGGGSYPDESNITIAHDDFIKRVAVKNKQ